MQNIKNKAAYLLC